MSRWFSPQDLCHGRYTRRIPISKQIKMKNRTVSLADIGVTAGPELSNVFAHFDCHQRLDPQSPAVDIPYHAFFAACNSFSLALT